MLVPIRVTFRHCLKLTKSQGAYQNRSIQPKASLIHARCSSTSASQDLSDKVPVQSVKKRAEGNASEYFVDWKRVECVGGQGGDGCISFMHLFANEFAGPDGGDGGNGGHIVFKADPTVKSLSNLQSRYKGLPGARAHGKHMHGANADHTFLRVPVGTLVKRLDNQALVADLDVPDSMFIAARGGAGGKGNSFFLSNKNRHPRIAEKGAPGEKNKWIVELKIMAHAGLIGFPNVGKSTFLRAISRARPKVANYPFTTLQPHVGIVQFEDYVQIAVADLPGLVQGSHKNRGLGIEFLRHAERCLCLLYVIDISQPQPWTQLEALKFELEAYSPGLSRRPHAVVCNKIDVPGSEEHLASFKEYLKNEGEDLKIFEISAKRGNNVLDLLKYIRGMFDEYNFRHKGDPEAFEW